MELCWFSEDEECCIVPGLELLVTSPSDLGVLATLMPQTLAYAPQGLARALSDSRDVFHVGKACKNFGTQPVTTAPAAVPFPERTLYVVGVLHPTIVRL